MLNAKQKMISNFTLLFVFACILLYVIFIQFLTPVLYGYDGYYHVAVSNFIKNFGTHYEFRWAQFSTFKNFFSDKDFLFHLFIIPFLYISDNIILAGKYAVIFYNILFLVIYILILRKYLPNFLVACFLLFPFLASYFTIYFSYLRPMTLANILTILCIYFLINKKWITLFVLSLFYSLAHISFPTVIIFACTCESIRYILNKEFFLRNIYAVILGIMLGCFIHPNFPNNLLSVHLNAILVPFYSVTRAGLDFGRELLPGTTKDFFIDNVILFFSFIVVSWTAFLGKTRATLSTFVWWACTIFYLALSSFAIKYWYAFIVLFFIFFASYLKDWLGEREWKAVLPKVNTFIIIYAILAFCFMPLISKRVGNDIASYISVNTHYENVARWLKKRIPPGETIYHAYWSDSPFFIALNPKNNYLVVLDPIYMFYRYSRIYLTYRDLKKGMVAKPYIALKEIFKVNYGYVRNESPLYRQIKNDKRHYKILYEDNLGIVFGISKKYR